FCVSVIYITTTPHPAMSSVLISICASGAKLSFGAFSVQGMVLATVVAIIMSLIFKLFESLHLLNE
ncbi:MAG: hypothetical protein KA989_04825, partial [Phascolarctobacterium sp.]|nr:hypothetical protein [Phascolarctobacterium sp.]